MTPADEYAKTAGHFLRIAQGVTDWDVPAPVEGWSARDVVRHLVKWFPPLLKAGAGIRLPITTSVDADPVDAWQSLSFEILGLLSQDPPADFSHENIGHSTVPLVIEQFYTPDIFMHTWDLARASGQEPGLDPARCENMLVGMRQMEEVLRASGQYGPEMPAPANASTQDKLMAFVGRDIDWRPGAAQA